MLSDREFDRVVGKFGFKTREGRDRLAWLEHDGKQVVFTKRSHQRGELPHADLIRQQLFLTSPQLRAAIKCTLDRDGYLAVLRAKGKL
jgi:hypothetical protein